MPTKKDDAPEVVPAAAAAAEQAVPLTAAAPAPIRARFRGGPGEYAGAHFSAERDAAGNVTERVFHTPARDLTEDDWQGMAAEHRAYVRQHPLYDVATDAQMGERARAAK